MFDEEGNEITWIEYLQSLFGKLLNGLITYKEYDEAVRESYDKTIHIEDINE